MIKDLLKKIFKKDNGLNDEFCKGFCKVVNNFIEEIKHKELTIGSGELEGRAEYIVKKYGYDIDYENLEKGKDVIYISKLNDYRYSKNTIEIYITYDLKCKNGFCIIINHKIDIKGNLC